MPSEEKEKSEFTLEEMQHMMSLLNGSIPDCEVCNSARVKLAGMICERVENGEIPEWMQKLGVVSIEHVTEGGAE